MQVRASLFGVSVIILLKTLNGLCFLETDVFTINNNEVGGDEGEKKGCRAVDVPPITSRESEGSDQEVRAVQVAGNEGGR